MERYPPLVLSFTKAYLCDTPFCNLSRDNCAIPIKTSTKEFCDTIATSIAHYEKYRCWASKLWSSSLAGCNISNGALWKSSLKLVAPSLCEFLVRMPSGQKCLQAEKCYSEFISAWQSITCHDRKIVLANQLSSVMHIFSNAAFRSVTLDWFLLRIATGPEFGNALHYMTKRVWGMNYVL